VNPLDSPWVFVTAGVAIGVGAAHFFCGRRDVALKRAIFPWFVVSAGTLFILYAALATGVPWVLVTLMPAVALLCWLNVRLVRFCDGCGTLLYKHIWFIPTRSCYRCGAPLGRAEEGGEGSRETGDGGEATRTEQAASRNKRRSE
jgi:hypothetical protein